MEGSDLDALEMSALLAATLPAICNWVANGGSLLLNAAPNEGSNIYFGFGVTLHYPDATSTNVMANPAHPIFNGPYVPAALGFSGNSFAHATVAGPGLTAVLTDPGA